MEEEFLQNQYKEKKQKVGGVRFLQDIAKKGKIHKRKVTESSSEALIKPNETFGGHGDDESEDIPDFAAAFDNNTPGDIKSSLKKPSVTFQDMQNDFKNE